ncbi:TIGR02679 family protein [Raineyella antarctica]|uniref:TIGR02679 family protein n=2 Tax=Raineyella antarctica TaxID=1577474 RepID=A0A1G6HH56_9ACTN|nr:TIGR02679 family protein [Raineyella antarctica]
MGLPVHVDPGDGVSAAILRWVLRDGQPPQRAREVSRVVQELPREGNLPLAALAAAVFADAHALDRSRPLGRAMARFLALRAAVADSISGGAARDSTVAPAFEFTDPLSTPAGWRAAWASAGVTCDAVSSQVLVLNLSLVGDAPAVAICGACPGEPTWLTLRSLEGSFGLASPQDVFVCENPTIVEAAAAMSGARSRTLVCTFGRPSAAAWALLRGLVPAARLHFRADGDVTGWSIVETFLTEFPQATTWRMPPGMTAFEEELLGDLLSDLVNEADQTE